MAESTDFTYILTITTGHLGTMLSNYHNEIGKYVGELCEFRARCTEPRIYHGAATDISCAISEFECKLSVTGIQNPVISKSCAFYSLSFSGIV